jgi:hypothetical protein
MTQAAATYSATLSSVLTYSNSGTAGSAAQHQQLDWPDLVYDDVTNLMTQTGGTINAPRATTAPTTTLFRQFITGLVIGNGGAASATFACVEGNFGANVGASICGNYNAGWQLHQRQHLQPEHPRRHLGHGHAGW